MKVMLIGGAGFIGSAFKSLYDYQYITIDLRNSDFKLDIVNSDIDTAFSRDIDVVIILAETGSKGDYTAVDYYNNNINGVLNIIKTVNKFNIKHIVYLSTSHVYGNGLNFTESSVPNPLNAYGRSKLSCEGIVKDFCFDNNIVYQILRLSSVNGAINNKFITQSICDDRHLISKLAEGYFKETKTVISNPNITRDYIHIKDLCACLNACLTSKVSGIFNVGSGVPTTSYVLATEFKNHTGYNGAVFRNTVLQLLSNTVNINEFQRMFDVQLEYSLNDIIKDTLEYYRRINS